MSSNNFDNEYQQFLDDEEEIDSSFAQQNQILLANYNSRRRRQCQEESSGPSGSVAGRAYKIRNREAGNALLMQDYFARNPTYNDEDFRRRFRMRRIVFDRLLQQVQGSNQYFQQRMDRAGRPGFSPVQKVSCALRMLAYATPADALDEYFRMEKSTAIQNLSEFCHTIIQVYRAEYLRHPTRVDLERLLKKADRRGFPGMIGSLDCMHWEWRNCPTAWQGTYTGRSRKPTIVLEAVASYDTWIWHAFFGIPGAQNDITVLGRSPLFDDLTNGYAPQVRYKVNGREHYMTYYLADGIYPKWATLVQSIKQPQNQAEQLFSRMQEAYRKDVERAFGILQSRFAIIRMPGRGWNPADLNDIMMTCIILHNMIVEDERDEYDDGESDDEETDQTRSRRVRASIYDVPDMDRNPRTENISLDEYMMRHRSIRSRATNNDLRKDLIAHLWARHGQGN